VGPNSRSITRSDCNAAVCLPYEVWECLWSQKATGTAWIGLEQNIIDIRKSAVSKWRQCLLACVRIVGHHFKQFYYNLQNEVGNVYYIFIIFICFLCDVIIIIHFISLFFIVKEEGFFSGNYSCIIFLSIFALYSELSSSVLSAGSVSPLVCWSIVWQLISLLLLCLLL